MTKCRESTCEHAATCTVHGPHGLVPYCEEHAGMYTAVMSHLGVSVLVLPGVVEGVPAPAAARAGEAE